MAPNRWLRVEVDLCLKGKGLEVPRHSLCLLHTILRHSVQDPHGDSHCRFGCGFEAFVHVPLHIASNSFCVHSLVVLWRRLPLKAPRTFNGHSRSPSVTYLFVCWHIALDQIVMLDLMRTMIEAECGPVAVEHRMLLGYREDFMEYEHTLNMLEFWRVDPLNVSRLWAWQLGTGCTNLPVDWNVERANR